MNLKNKEFYSLNLSPKCIQLAIQNARDKISETLVLQEKFMPEYQEKKKFYEQVRFEFQEVENQWLSLQENIKDQEIIVNAFVTFNKATSPNKKIQKFIDVKDKPKGTEKDMNVKWIKECERVLGEQNRFMSWDELWSDFSKDQRIIAACNKNITKFSYMKLVAMKGITKHCLIERRYKGRDAKLCLYREKFGLADWVDDNNIPSDPSHMKEFAFS